MPAPSLSSAIRGKNRLSDIAASFGLDPVLDGRLARSHKSERDESAALLMSSIR